MVASVFLFSIYFEVQKKKIALFCGDMHIIHLPAFSYKFYALYQASHPKAVCLCHIILNTDTRIFSTGLVSLTLTFPKSQETNDEYS